MKFGFVGASYTAKSNNVADEECINWFAETNETSGAQAQRSYFGTPGLVLFSASDDGPTRGECNTGTQLFWVIADTLYEVAADGTKTAIGTVGNDGLLVSIAASNIQLLIISAGQAYCYTLSSASWAANTVYLIGAQIIDAAGHVQQATAAAWAANTNYAVGAEIIDPNGNLQKAASASWSANTVYAVGAQIVDPGAHIQKASAAAWAASTNYVLGAEIVDSNGNIQRAYQVPWVANTVYPINAEIVDSNGNVQKVTTAGTSGASTPTWAGSGTTADNTIVWTYQASAGGNAGTSGATVPVWSESGGTLDGTSTLIWVFQGSASGNAGTSGGTIPTFNDAGGTTLDGTGTLVWADQGVATGAGTSGTTIPTFQNAGNTVDAGTLIWVFQSTANGNAGTSGATIPSFSDTGGSTPDGPNTLVWIDKGLRLLNVSSQLAGTPIQTDYSDGYFIVCFESSNKFQMSAILDGTTWPGIQVNAVSVFSENIVSIIVSHRELWVFGSQHAQPYQDTGSLEIFDVIPGALIDTGAAATFGRNLIDNTIFWISEDARGARQAWRGNGYTPLRISTHAVETSLASYSADQISNLVSYSYQDGGHLFWVLYVPGTDCTWVYDVAESLWHKRAEWNPQSATYGPHPSWSHAYVFGKHIVGDWGTGNLYEMNLNYFTDNGALIRRLRRSPTINNELERTFHAELKVEFNVGNGPQPPLTDGDGNPRPPQAMLRWSNNSGSTWSNEHVRGCGMAGEYDTFVRWQRLGYGRRRVYELVVSDPIFWAITDAYLRLS